MTIPQASFLRLLSAAVWNRPACSLPALTPTDWQALLDLSDQQACTGVIADAVTRLPQEQRPPKPIYFSFIAAAGEIERENKRMNSFAPELQSQLRRKGVMSLLLKGQGVAQCYPQPLHRHSGDIDLYVPDATQYTEGKRLMRIISSEYEDETRSTHAEYTTNGFIVELHGDFGANINRRTTRHLSQWRQERIGGEALLHRSLSLDGGEIWTPTVQFDAVFIFVHMFHHYSGGGVGLRQISDWMLFVATAMKRMREGQQPLHDADRLDIDVLKADLKRLGLIRPWQMFASLAVSLLDCPAELMPLYDTRYDKHAAVLIDTIFKTGNFGQLQKEKQLPIGTLKWVKKTHTAFGLLPVYFRMARLFPQEAVYGFCSYVHQTFVPK